MARYSVTLVDYDSDLFDITPASLADMAETLGNAGAELKIGQQRTEESVVVMAKNADVVMIQSVRPLLNRHTIPHLTRCRGIIRMGLGYDSIDVGIASEFGILVSNVADWCTEEVAEHTIALLFACARRLAPLNRRAINRQWHRLSAIPCVRIHGKTLGLIGFGRVGQSIARRLRSFGLTVIAADPYIDSGYMESCGVEKVPLEELLHRSDFVTIHTPLTDATYHFLNAAAFDAMKPGAVLVNTSRGAVVDEQALVTALQSGKLLAAGLDVTEKEPLPADSPLYGMENVLVTPHVASYSVSAVDMLYRNSAGIAAQLLLNCWPPTIVNQSVRPRAEERWGVFED
ncbi:MAG: C-terminal binding protein [Chloroflexota bacterium]|nr:C-terminal binding protein [Chloroflexota bacterium]